MEYTKDVKLSGSGSLDDNTGKASGDNAAAASVANLAGKTPNPQAPLEVGKVMVDCSEYKK